MLPTHLQNNPFFDESTADKEVIAFLSRTIRRLEIMPKLLRLTDGRVVRVIGEVEDVSQEELQAIHDDLLRDADNVNQFIDRPVEEVPATEPVVPTDAPAAVESSAAVPTPEVPTESIQGFPVAPVQPEQPVAAPVEPVAEPVPAPQVTVVDGSIDTGQTAASTPFIQ